MGISSVFNVIVKSELGSIPPSFSNDVGVWQELYTGDMIGFWYKKDHFIYTTATNSCLIIVSLARTDHCKNIVEQRNSKLLLDFFVKYRI